MGTTVRASLFYGYLEPERDEDEDYEDEEETPWDKAHAKKVHNCTVDICGYDERLRCFLAVEKSLQVVYPAEVKSLDLNALHSAYLDSTWDEQLRQAAKAFDIDLVGLQASWHLVCLYF